MMKKLKNKKQSLSFGANSIEFKDAEQNVQMKIIKNEIRNREKFSKILKKI